MAELSESSPISIALYDSTESSGDLHICANLHEPLQFEHVIRGSSNKE